MDTPRIDAIERFSEDQTLDELVAAIERDIDANKPGPALDPAGAVEEVTEWHRIQIFNEATIKLCEKYIREGTHLHLEGALETRKWKDKEGVERSTTEITLRPYNGELRILSFKDDKAPEEEAAELPADLGEPLPA